jgi:hypothetical protein
MAQCSLSGLGNGFGDHLDEGLVFAEWAGEGGGCGGGPWCHVEGELIGDAREAIKSQDGMK